PAGDGTTDAAATPCTGGATDVGVTAEEIVVAAMVTASGPLPGATEGQFRGAAAYFAKVNAEGGVCGRQIRILKGDDGLDPQRARGEFLRLEPQVLAFVGSLAVADSGYVDLVEQTGVPYVGTFVDPAGRSLPSTEPRTEPNVAHSGPYVYYRQAYPDVANVGFMYADVGGVRSNTPGAIAGFQRAGFNVVYNSGASPTSPDFTAEIINLRSAGAQMVYLFAFEVNMHVRFARNMRQQNWEPELKVSQIGYNSRLVELLGDTADGWSNHLTYVPVINEGEEAISPALAEFRQWHGAAFPGASIDLFPVNGWRDAAVFVDALRTVGADVTRTRVLEAIRAIEESDGGGLFAPFSPARGEGATCFVIVRVVGQRWTREHPASGYECGLGERYGF
ncbi:MAG: ABC transporter substrate-binding protein, partial [Acidimicrobiia bacterium]|nr:ABC transporter substrate-binding protein [Acidimicrobiia bacterium]